MGIRFTSPCGSSGCGGCGTTICVTVCGGIPVYGALLQIWTNSGMGTLVASCTTPSSGCCQFSLTGTYYVTVKVSGTLEYAATKTLSGTVAIALGSNSGFVCCGGYAIPETLTLTDAAGSLSFVYCPTCPGSYPMWTGGHSVTEPSCEVTTPNNVCVVAAPSSGPVRVCYSMTCNSSASPKFTLTRSWSWVYDGPTPTWYQSTAGFTPGQFCLTAPPAICGSPLTDTASFAGNPSSTSPFAISGTPSPAGGNATGDPVGGSVAISA